MIRHQRTHNQYIQAKAYDLHLLQFVTLIHGRFFSIWFLIFILESLLLGYKAVRESEVL